MKTLDLTEASELLKIHPQTILQLARAGNIPAAKPGKCWVFIDADLIDWLRTNYIANQCTASPHCKRERHPLQKEKRTIATSNLLSKEKLYTDLLEPKTKKNIQ